jgi:hypothetical protein
MIVAIKGHAQSPLSNQLPIGTEWRENRPPQRSENLEDEFRRLHFNDHGETSAREAIRTNT